MKIIRLLFILALGFYGLTGAFHLPTFGLLSGANLLFHEAGHVFFQWLGPTMGILGGTLLQLLIPLGLAIGFIYKGQLYSSCVLFFWFAQNFFDISPYMKDARAMALPYVGGEIHDWHYLFSKWGVLQWDQEIGRLTWLMGLLLMLGAIIAGIYFSFKDNSLQDVGSTSS